MNRTRLLNFTPASINALTANKAASSGPFVILRAAAVQHAVLFHRIERVARQSSSLPGGTTSRCPKTPSISSLADLGVTIVPAVAIMRAEPQVAGDLQSFAQRLIDGRAEWVAATPLIAHTGDTHQLVRAAFSGAVGIQVLG